MKAILRWGTGLFGLLLLTSVSHAYYWVTPVTKCPYGRAPDTCNTAGFYLVNQWGQVSGPHYYLVPPFPPHQGVLPGPIGQAIRCGNLPHPLLMSKEGMSPGNMPMLGQKSPPGGPPPGPGPYPHSGMQVPYGMQGPGPMAPMPMMPGGPGGPGQFGQVQPFDQFNAMQQFGRFDPLQGPRMGPIPHGAPHAGGGQFPSHPFTRSPRDFFMWGTNMDEERARGNRPFPVP